VDVSKSAGGVLIFPLPPSVAIPLGEVKVVVVVRVVLVVVDEREVEVLKVRPGAVSDEVAELDELGLVLVFELFFFPTTPPTTPPITAPRTRTARTNMVILPLRLRQKDLVGFWAYVGAIFSCEFLSASGWVIGGGGESIWVEVGRVGRVSSKSTL